MTNRMPELLCPAGNLESLEAALHFGADAVYGGMRQFGLRAFAGNFDEGALTQAVEKMHGAGKKFYLTMNIFPFDDQLDDFIAAAKAARDIGVDAAIVSDLGAIAALRREVPELPLHVSTQASTVNAEAVRVYRDMGCERVILARETSIARAKEIIRRVPEMEIETFVHGASCMAYSGRCLLSAAMAGRSGNQGECAQPCRWHYSVVEEKRPGEYMPVCEDENGTYIFSAHDLNLMPLLPELVDAGIKSFGVDQTPPYPVQNPEVQIKLHEEHCAIFDSDSGLQVGEQVAFYPGHCCTTINLYDFLYLMRDGEIVDKIPVTGRGKNV